MKLAAGVVANIFASSQADNDSSLVLKANQRRRNMTLLDNGWTDEQSQGLLRSLNLDGGTPKWKREHLQRLPSWCSVQEKDPTSLDGQLDGRY